MTKKLTICIALTMLIIGCKKITVDFTYSPLQPKAGEVKRILDGIKDYTFPGDIGDQDIINYYYIKYKQ